MLSSVKTSATRALYPSWRRFIERVLAASRDNFEKKRSREQCRRIGFGFLELTADRFAPFLRHPAKVAQPDEIDLDETCRPLPDVAARRDGQDARMRFHHFQPSVTKKRRELERNVRFAARGAPALHHLVGEGFHSRTARHESERFVVAVFMENSESAGPQRAGNVVDQLFWRGDEGGDPAAPGEVEVETA